MANIQIVGDIIQTNILSRYEDKDKILLNSLNIQENFGLINDYIEYHIIDSAGNLVSSDYNYKNYKLSTNSVINPVNNGLPIIEIDPLKDIQAVGYNSGQYISQYNFFRNRLSSLNAELYIQQISADRTEIRLASDILTNQIIDNAITELISQINDSAYYQDFLINLGSNRQYLITNLALDQTGSNSTILIKLYESLPATIELKNSLWIVEEIIEAYVFDINLEKFILPDAIPTLKGPNFNIEIPTKNTKITSYENYSTLINEISSSQNQILNYLNQQSIQLNIDYADYNNFSHFGSVNKRISNFYDKVKQIEDYNNFIIINTPITGSKPNLINDIVIAKSSITSLITNFDRYENYLYFESSSYTYPKISNNKPYILQSTGSTESINWYNNQLYSSSLYDSENLDNLENTIPEYIRENDDNNPYIMFINMIGHYFDNIWIYLKAIPKIYENKNSSNEGISKDIVQYMLQSLGLNIYNNDSDNLSSYLLGANSGSIDQDNISDKDLLEEIYRRLYHNLPYLTKAKGTIPGLRALITCFGVPSDILDINEYGGNSQSSSFEISEISDNKIRIIDNHISSSVLSNLLKIEDIPDSQLIEDLPYLDISFNPNKPLNNKIKSDLSGSFNIDNYIGDPSLESSSSYSSLNQLKKTEYGTYFPQFNYSQYIKLVSLFDNSLFKMIQDFIPERANASIGILIESPLLERNKIPRFNPNVLNQDILDANYNTPTISEDNSYLYQYLSGSREAFYTGKITGSYLNINEIFEKANINPYLNHTASFSQVEFKHSEFNNLLNNVSGSLKSKIRVELEPLYNNGIIIGQASHNFAELQDSYLSLSSYQLSRYLGSKTFSKEYNNYTSASDSYLGDYSFGKTAAIDHDVLKIGLLSQVTESQFLSKRNNLTIKYLIDSQGNLTELNQRNKNWEEVQNTFKSGDDLTISLFDNQKYSNQRSIDGSKLIFNSGYSYYPILYFSSIDSIAYFDFEQEIKSNQFKAVILPKNIDNGSGNYHFDTGSGLFYDIFNDTSDIDGGYNDNNNYALGSLTGGIATASYYTIPSTGIYSFQIQSSILASTTLVSQSVNIQLQISSSDGSINSIQTSSFTSNNINGSAIEFIEPAHPAGTTRRYINMGVTSVDGPIDVYSYTNSYIGTIYSSSIDVQYTRGEDINGGGTTINAFVFQLLISPTSLFGISSFKNYIISSNNSLNNTFIFNQNIPSTTYSSGTQIYFKLITDNLTTFTYQANNGYAQSSLQAGLPEVTGSFIKNISANSVELNPDFNSFLNDYIYVPISSSLYSKYGDIDYQFNINPGDLMIMTDNNDVIYEINISDVNPNINGLDLISNSIPLGLIPADIKEFLLLKQVQDETNIILRFIKKPGLTSLGLVIPSNLSKNVLNNIDTITSNVKPKLIDLGV